MAIISVTTFTSDTETVTRTKLNGLAGNLLTEFNGNIDNANIKANAAIAATKLNLATVAQDVAFTGTLDFSGATITAQTTFADLVATTADINGGTMDGVTVGAASAPTVTDIDINGGTIDGVTIGGAAAPTVTDLGTVTTADINGGTIDGVTLGAAAAVTITADSITLTNAVTEFSTDGTLGDNSDAAIPTEKATRTYVQSVLTHELVSSNTFADTFQISQAVAAGETFILIVEGTVNGGSVSPRLRIDNDASGTDYYYSSYGVNESGVVTNANQDVAGGFPLVATMDNGASFVFTVYVQARANKTQVHWQAGTINSVSHSEHINGVGEYDPATPTTIDMVLSANASGRYYWQKLKTG